MPDLHALAALAEALDGLAAAEHMQRRAIQETLTLATAAYWERRAATFESCRPRPGDYVGSATRDDLERLEVRCADVATECRRHAALLRESVAAPCEEGTLWMS